MLNSIGLIVEGTKIESTKYQESTLKESSPIESGLYFTPNRYSHSIFPQGFVFIVGSFLLPYVLLPLASSIRLFNHGLIGTAYLLFSEPAFWLLQPLVLVVCLLPDICWYIARRTFWPELADVLADEQVFVLGYFENF